MKTTFYPKGVCSKRYELEVENGVIKELSVLGGCNGNLSGITRLIRGKTVDAVIPLLRGTTCGTRPTSCPDQISYALEEAARKDREDRERVYSSDYSIDMEKEYFFRNYEFLRRENSPVYGCDSADEIIFESLSFDELCYLLSQKGTYLILFGGRWSTCTQSVIDRVQYLAKQHGISTVYQFDFRMDGQTREASIKETLTAQLSYDGPDKTDSLPGAENNYAYGEMVRRFLPNLGDWTDTKAVIEYLDIACDVQSVPDVTEPFLFLYNKDNTVNRAGASVPGTCYPIVSAVSMPWYRGAEGKLYTAEKPWNDSTLVKEPEAILEEKIFSLIGSAGLEPSVYTHSNYIHDAYTINGRGHSIKTENAFQEGEQINLQMVTYDELQWILSRRGTFLILFGGSWCANTQAAVATINDYAVANHARVYMFDTRLDGKYPLDFWSYPRAREMQIRSFKHPLRYLYIDLIEKYLRNISTIYAPGGNESSVISYTDAEGNEHTVGKLQAPHFLAVNKENTGTRGGTRTMPILAYCERMYELVNCNQSFIYSEPNYMDYKAGVYRVFYTYAKKESIEAKQITVDRTAPVVAGEVQRNMNVSGMKVEQKVHNWWAERGAKKA